jgi:cytochrome c-type biogenesis protein CcmH
MVRVPLLRTAAALALAVLLNPMPLAQTAAPAGAPPGAAAPAPAAGAPAAAQAPTTAAPAAAPGPAVADKKAYEERLRKLSSELRCLVCQNQTLADSNAELAVDLRRQVEGLMGEGKSDDQIKAYLVDRYGDFVLYRPPVQGNTMLLWFGPFALLLIGAVAWLLVQRRSRQRRAAGQASAESDRERMRKLLES